MTMNTEQQPRRISLVTRTLRPLQHRIGQLQEAAAFMAARNQFAAKAPDNRVTEGEVAEKRAALAEVAALFDATVSDLPEKLRRDTRLASARLAMSRLDATLADLIQR
jgi:hypothetical protein